MKHGTSILITGGLGWLGQSLIRHLLSNPGCLGDGFGETTPIRIFERNDVPKAQHINNSRINYFFGDIRKIEDLKPFFKDQENSIVIHTAAVIHPKKAGDFFSVNVDGSRNVLNLSSEYKIKKLIALSSNSPFGFNTSPSDWFNEQTPYNPHLGYGRSKMEMERLFTKDFPEFAKRAVIIRAPWFYGPHQPLRQTNFFRLIRRGLFPVVGEANNRRSMVYVDNLVQGILLAATNQIADGQTYWIADKHPYKMREIIQTVRTCLEVDFGLEVKKQRFHLPNFFSDVAYIADKSIQAVGSYNQNVHVLSELNKNIICSICKAERQLGYKPKVELTEGMRRSIAQLISQGIEI